MPLRAEGRKSTQVPWREMAKEIPRSTRQTFAYGIKRRLIELQNEGHIVVAKGITLNVSEDDMLPYADDGTIKKPEKQSKSSSSETEEGTEDTDADEQKEIFPIPLPPEPGMAIVTEAEILGFLASLEKRPMPSHIVWTIAHGRIAKYKSNITAFPAPTYKRILAILKAAAEQHKNDWTQLCQLMETSLCDQASLASSNPLMLQLLQIVCRLSGVSTSTETLPGEWDSNLRGRLLEGNWKIAVRMDRILSLWNACRRLIETSHYSLWLQCQDELGELKSALGTDGHLYDFVDVEIRQLEEIVGEEREEDTMMVCD